MWNGWKWDAPDLRIVDYKAGKNEGKLLLPYTPWGVNDDDDDDDDKFNTFITRLAPTWFQNEWIEKNKTVK